MKTTTKIAVVITFVIAIAVMFTAMVCAMKLPTRADDELVQETYIEGYEVSSLNITSDTHYYIAIRNDFHSAVIEVSEEMFASVAVGEVVNVEVTATHEDGNIDLDFEILSVM